MEKKCLRLYRSFSDQTDYDYILNTLKKNQNKWKMKLFCADLDKVEFVISYLL